MPDVTPEQVLEALQAVTDPDRGDNIVALRHRQHLIHQHISVGDIPIDQLPLLKSFETEYINSLHLIKPFHQTSDMCQRYSSSLTPQLAR